MKVVDASVVVLLSAALVTCVLVEEVLGSSIPLPGAELVATVVDAYSEDGCVGVVRAVSVELCFPVVLALSLVVVTR